MNNKSNNNLIYDVGMHIGRDTEFYLQKGFHVIAIEANPALAEQAAINFSDFVKNKKLQIFNIAINDQEGETDFYINLQKDDWGTLSKEYAERNEKLGTTNETINVKCVRFENIINECGMPYYIKIDIEGADTYCLDALKNFSDKPKFISIEATLNENNQELNDLNSLRDLGYKEFKIVNQALNHTFKCPDPALEGTFVDASFDGFCSGPFGEEAPGIWLDFNQTVKKLRKIERVHNMFGANGKYYNTAAHRLYNKFMRLTGGEPVGWYDIHGKLPD